MSPFFFSRLAILGSMGMLIIVLVLNVYLLNSQKSPQTIKSQAAYETTSKTTSLPSNCRYNDNAVTCTADVRETLTIPLPILPQGCNYEAANGGYSLYCTK